MVLVILCPIKTYLTRSWCCVYKQPIMSNINNVNNTFIIIFSVLNTLLVLSIYLFIKYIDKHLVNNVFDSIGKKYLNFRVGDVYFIRSVNQRQMLFYIPIVVFTVLFWYGLDNSIQWLITITFVIIALLLFAQSDVMLIFAVMLVVLIDNIYDTIENGTSQV